MRSGGDQRPRGRPYGNRPSQQQGGQQRSQSFNSPVRGNPLQLYQRYLTLAQDALRSEDRIAAEGYYQHAEHYYRVAHEGRDGHRPDGQRSDGQRSDGRRAEGQRAGGQRADGHRGEAQPAETSPPIDRTAVEAGIVPAEPGDGEEVFHTSSGASVPGEQP